MLLKDIGHEHYNHEVVLSGHVRADATFGGGGSGDFGVVGVGLVFVDKRVRSHDQVNHVLAPGASNEQGVPIDGEAKIAMLHVEKALGLVQVEVENECHVVEGIGQESVETDAAAKHHQEVEKMPRGIVCDVTIMGIVRELVVHENFGAGSKEFECSVQLVRLHQVLVLGQRHSANGNILVTRGRTCSVTGGVT